MTIEFFRKYIKCMQLNFDNKQNLVAALKIM